MNVAAIRLALREAITAQGFTPYAELPDDPQLPAIAVSWPNEIAYHRTMGSGCQLDIDIKVAVPSGVDAAASQRQLDEAMSWPGWLRAIEQHETDAWRTLVVERSSGVRPVAFGQVPALMFDVNLTIKS